MYSLYIHTHLYTHTYIPQHGQQAGAEGRQVLKTHGLGGTGDAAREVDDQVVEEAAAVFFGGVRGGLGGWVGWGGEWICFGGRLKRRVYTIMYVYTKGCTHAPLAGGGVLAEPLGELGEAEGARGVVPHLDVQGRLDVFIGVM